MSKKQKRFLIISSILVLIAAAVYLAADRYLIKHVEIADVNAYTSTLMAKSASSYLSTSSVNTANSIEATDVASGSPTRTDITYDDWNYQSSDMSISINTYTNGSGDDTVTYYVADVILSDATQLKSAFAANQFGQNIIAYTSVIASQNNAIFAINGDYYGFRSDGILIRNGVVYRDKPARTGLAIYRNGTMQVYSETNTTAEKLLAAGVWNTLSFGPALLDDGQIVYSPSVTEIDTNIGNHPIQGDQPRTGLGVISKNHLVFIVVDGRSKGYSKGVSLVEFSEMFQKMGCTEAYNLDGGGSSTMYFMGRVVNNPLGKNRERGTSDILFIGSEE